MLLTLSSLKDLSHYIEMNGSTDRLNALSSLVRSMLPGRTERRVGTVLVLALGSSPTESSSCERNGWYSERIERAGIVQDDPRNQCHSNT